MSKPIKPVAPTMPQRTQSPAVFSDNVDGFLTYIPTATTYFDNVATFADERVSISAGSAAAAIISATDAANSATSAAASAGASAASASFIGDWLGKTGSVAVGVSVRHKGAFWRSLVVIANIATAEPSVSADWAFVSGTRWSGLVTSSQSVPANSQMSVTASGAIVEITLPVFTVNDFLVLHCTADSDNNVRVLNPSFTIRGARGSAVAGENLLLSAGDTVHLVYVAVNVLEVV